VRRWLFWIVTGVGALALVLPWAWMPLALLRSALGYGWVGGLGAAGVGAIVAVGALVIQGWIGQLIERLVELLTAVPSVVLVPLVAQGGEGRVGWVLLALGLTRLPAAAMEALGVARRLEHTPYFQLSEGLGASRWWAVRRHVLPALLPALGARAAIEVGTIVLVDVALGAVGLRSFPGGVGEQVARWLLDGEVLWATLALGAAGLLAAAGRVASEGQRRRGWGAQDGEHHEPTR
jgi:ABC-type dipeptide/oligopeptide/nickel transport system permease subunit